MIADVVAWARARGIAARLGAELPQRSLAELGPLADDPTINFGRWQRSVPGAAIAPATEAELAALVAELAARGVAYRARGSGHSSGALGLAARDEVLVELAQLRTVAPLTIPYGDAIELAASATLEELVGALAQREHRPVGLPTNLAQTIAGTVAVGGFTESCHLHGLFAEAVVAARVVTPAGALVEVTADDPRFAALPGGAGAHGLITAVALRSAPGRLRLAARMLRWRTLEAFLADAQRIAALRLYGYLRPRLVDRAHGFEVEALAGNYGALADAAHRLVPGATASEVEALDLEAALLAAARAPKPFATPALELAFPLATEAPAALAFARAALARFGRHLPRGIALALAPARPRFPHLPLPADGWGLLVAVRPELPPADAAALVPALRALHAEVPRAIVYRVSI